MEVRPGYKRTEVGVIPEDWDVLPFKELFKISAGGDLNPRLSSSDQDEIHYFPIYSNALTDRGLYGYCSYADHPAHSITITARGTLGVATYRDHQYSAIGRVLVLEPKQKAVGRFFAELINNRINFAIESTGVPQLTAPQIGGYSLVLPPYSDQWAIATVVSDVNALVGALEKLIAKKRDLKLAAMQQLLTGQTRLPGYSDKWEVTMLGEIANVRTGPFGSSLHESDYVESGTPIITVEHLGEFGVEHFNLPRVSDFDRDRLRAYELKIGDIVFSRVGSVDRNALIRESEDGWLFSGRLLRVRPDTLKADARFLTHQFHAEAFLTSVREVAVGQTMACLNTQILKGVPVTLPPLPEQSAIAAVLSDMNAEIEELEQRLAKTRDLNQAMMQELLTGRIRLEPPEARHG
jgi:type I restriction enzyme S subunit